MYRRCYATVRRARQLSPHVAKSKTPDQPGLLNSGAFAKLHAVETRDRASQKAVLDKVQEFSALKIAAPLRHLVETQTLGHLEVVKPTAVQTLAIRAIQKSQKLKANDLKVILVAAETGSGKTLSYLLPLLTRLMEAKKTDRSQSPSVKGVVLVPTMELVRQVYEVAKTLCDAVGVSVCASARGVDSEGPQMADLVVSTPVRLQRQYGSLSQCTYMAIDEADTLMEQSFAADTLKAVSLASSLDTLVFCSATIPRAFDRTMRKLYPEAVRVVTPGLHKISRHVDFRVVEVYKPPFLNSKELALRQALYVINKDNTEPGLIKRVLVFVNRSQDIEAKVLMLREHGYPAVGTSKHLSSQERSDIVHQFGRAKPAADDRSVQVEVLVTNDLMARGIDLHNVRTVILYDLPHSSVDLLHRAGRTGRLGKRGRVLLFVDRKDAKGWVKGLEKVVRNGQALA